MDLRTVKEFRPATQSISNCTSPMFSDGWDYRKCPRISSPYMSRRKVAYDTDGTMPPNILYGYICKNILLQYPSGYMYMEKIIPA